MNEIFFTGIHEIAHSAGFGIGMPNANRALGIFANLPIGIPFSVAFKGYHLEHHKVIINQNLKPNNNFSKNGKKKPGWNFFFFILNS